MSKKSCGKGDSCSFRSALIFTHVLAIDHRYVYLLQKFHYLDRLTSLLIVSTQMVHLLPNGSSWGNGHVNDEHHFGELGQLLETYGIDILMYTLLWIGFYLLVSMVPIPVSVCGKGVTDMSRTDELDVKNRVVAMCHGLFICLYCGHEFFYLHQTLVPTNEMFDAMSPVAEGGIVCISKACGQPNNSFENRIFCISLSYFIYDFLAMAYEGLLDWAMSLHHIAGVLGMLAVLSSNNSSYLLICGMFIGEVSNPFMHIRMILKRLSLRYTVAFEACELAFMVLYTSGRAGVATPIFYYICMCEHMHWILKVSMGVLWVQSIYVIVFSIRGAMVTHIKGVAKRRAAGIKMGRRHVHQRSYGAGGRLMAADPIWYVAGCYLFTALTPQELEILGIDPSKEEKQTI